MYSDRPTCLQIVVESPLVIRASNIRFGLLASVVGLRSKVFLCGVALSRDHDGLFLRMCGVLL